MNILSQTLSLLLVTAAMGACQNGEGEITRVKHTLNAPLFSGPTSFRVTVDPQESPEERDIGPGFVTDPMDPVLARLQYWTDAIRVRFGDRIPANFPKTQVVLDLSSEINAHTYGKPVCFDVVFGEPSATHSVSGV